MKYLAVLLILVFLAACSTPQTDTYRVGVLVPLTTPAAIYGEALIVGAQTAVDQINTQGGNVELIVEDNANNPKTAVDAYRKLQLQDVDVIFSAMSGASAAIAPLAAQDNIPVVTALTYVDLSDNEIVYQYMFSAETITADAIHFFQSKNVSTIALLGVNVEAAISLFEVLGPALEQANITVIGQEMYEPNAPDARAEILKLTEQKPQAIFAWALRPDRLTPQITEQYQGILVLGDTPIGANTFRKVAALNGTFAQAPLHVIKETPQYDTFNGLFPADTIPHAVWSYDAIHLLWQAKQIGPLPESIHSIGTFSGLAGEIDVSQKGKPHIPMQMVQIKNFSLVR